MAEDYGIDIACLDDADSRWRTTSGRNLVLQDIYHRFTTGAVLGRIINPDGTVEPNPAAENYGEDVRLLVGEALPDDVGYLGPRFAAVAQRSRRIDTADCVVTREDAGNGNILLRIAVSGVGATGPFSFVFLASSTTLKLLSGGSQ
jgi:hypothetical protein